MGAISRRRFAAVAAAPGLLVAAGRAVAQGTRNVAVGDTPPTASSWPTFIALELGYFTRYRVDVAYVVIDSVASIAQQLLAGSLDVGQISSTQLVEAVRNGAAMRYFLEGVSRPPYAILAQKQYKRYADLRGKTIILSGPSGITVVFAQRMLAAGGLRLGDVDIVYAGATSDRYAALKSGSVAAAMLFPPFSFRAADEGFTLLGSESDVMPPFPFSGWAVTDAYAQPHRDVLIDFTKGYLRAVRFLNDPANRGRALEILTQRISITPADAVQSYDVLVAKSTAFPNDGKVVPGSFAIVIDALAQLKIISPPLPNATALYTDAIVDEAVAQLAREPKG